MFYLPDLQFDILKKKNLEENFAQIHLPTGSFTCPGLMSSDIYWALRNYIPWYFTRPQKLFSRLVQIYGLQEPPRLDILHMCMYVGFYARECACMRGFMPECTNFLSISYQCFSGTHPDILVG